MNVGHTRAHRGRALARRGGDGVAQGPPARGEAAATAAHDAAAAPVDLTGYWVSVISEDWRWRMVTPIKRRRQPAAQREGRRGGKAGTRRGKKRRVCSARRTAPPRSCGSRPRAHHMAGRQHAQAGDRSGHADAPVSFRCARRRRTEPASVAGQSVAKWERPPRGRRGPKLPVFSARARAGASLEVRRRACVRATCARTACPIAQRHGERVLRLSQGTERRRMVHGDDHGARPAVSNGRSSPARISRNTETQGWRPTPCAAR